LQSAIARDNTVRAYNTAVGNHGSLGLKVFEQSLLLTLSISVSQRQWFLDFSGETIRRDFLVNDFPVQTETLNAQAGKRYYDALREIRDHISYIEVPVLDGVLTPGSVAIELQKVIETIDIIIAREGPLSSNCVLFGDLKQEVNPITVGIFEARTASFPVLGAWIRHGYALVLSSEEDFSKTRSPVHVESSSRPQSPDGELDKEGTSVIFKDLVLASRFRSFACRLDLH
jgi:hypothetical protein